MKKTILTAGVVVLLAGSCLADGVGGFYQFSPTSSLTKGNGLRAKFEDCAGLKSTPRAGLRPLH
jgi:hypothetical protein